MCNGRWKLFVAALVTGLLFSATDVGICFEDEERPLRTLDSHFPFSPPNDAAQWNERAQALRLHLQMSLGLWPLPERSPLNAVIHGRIDQGDYSVEKVYFESFPGYFVTGNLYRSTKASDSRCPAILCPHGHYVNGRFYDAGGDEIKRAIGNGEETFESNARSPLQARCAHLARMGCTVFHYDMIGYADSQQIPVSVAHDFSKQRPDENGADGWGFFSPRAEMHLQSIMGLQTWNSIRAIDFVQSLPEVDPDRIGVTGSSGGGTQSFVLAALDERVTASFPAVMVSTGMQGGCTCENCCNLRVRTGNVEIAALFAPKPMGLSAADDWTRNMPEDGFPQLKQLYQTLGKPENVYLTASTSFPHGFNQIARRVMYAWFDKHLRITGKDPDIAKVEQGNMAEDSPWRERESRFLTIAELTVWDKTHPAPESGTSVEHAVTLFWARSQQRMTHDLEQQNPNTVFQVADSLLYERISLDPFRLTGAKAQEVKIKGFPNLETHLIVADSWTWGPYQFLHCTKNAGSNKEQPITVVVTGKLITDILNHPPSNLKLLLDENRDVIVMAGDRLGVPNQLVENGREAAGYTYGYNRSRLADAAAALRCLLCAKSIEYARIDLVLEDSVAPVGILAAAATPGNVFGSICLPDNFRFETVDSLFHPWFLPGALKMGDVPGLIEAANPQNLVIIGQVREDIEARFKDEHGKVATVDSEEDAIRKLFED